MSMDRGRDTWRTFIRDTGFVAIPKVIAGASLVGLNFLIARQLPVADFGVFAFGLAVVLLSDGVFGSALDAAVLRHAPGGVVRASRLTPVESAAVVLKLMVGAAGMALLVTAAAAARGFGLGAGVESKPWLAIGIATIAMLLFRSVLTHLQVTHRFRAYGITDMSHTLLRILLASVVLAAGIASAERLLLCFAIAAMLVTLWYSGPLLADLRRATWGSDVAALARATRVTFLICGVGALVARLDMLILGIAGSAPEVGLFGVATVIAMLPALIGAYIAPALTPRIVPYCQTGRFRSLFIGVQAGLIALGVVIAIAGGLLARPLVAALFGARYIDAVPVVQVLLPAGVAGLVSFPLMLHFLLFFSPKTYLILDLVSLPVLVPAYWYAARHGGAFGVAAVTSIAVVSKAIIAQAVAIALVGKSASWNVDQRPGSLVVAGAAASTP